MESQEKLISALHIGKLQLLLWKEAPQEIKWSQQCQSCSTFQEKHCTNTINLGKDENDEAACWALICREAYKDMMEEGIREKVIEYWDNHSRAIPGRKHVLRQHFGRGIYKEHCKHVMEMTRVVCSRNSKNRMSVSRSHLSYLVS